MSVMCVDEPFATPVGSPGQRVNDGNEDALIDIAVVDSNIVEETT